MFLPSLSLFGRVGSLTTPENICGYASALDVNKQTASSRVPVPSAQPQKASQTGHLTSRFQQVTLVLNIIINYPILSYPILSYPILSYPILSYPNRLPQRGNTYRYIHSSVFAAALLEYLRLRDATGRWNLV